MVFKKFRCSKCGHFLPVEIEEKTKGMVIVWCECGYANHITKKIKGYFEIVE